MLYRPWRAARPLSWLPSCPRPYGPRETARLIPGPNEKGWPMDATTIVLVLALLLADRLARIIEQLVRELRRQRR